MSVFLPKEKAPESSLDFRLRYAKISPRHFTSTWRRSLFIVMRFFSRRCCFDKEHATKNSTWKRSFRGLISRRMLLFLLIFYISFIPAGNWSVRVARLFFSRIRADARPYPAGSSLEQALVNARTKDWLPQLCIAANCTRLQVCWPLFRRSIHRPYCNTAAELHAIGHLVRECVCSVIAVYSQWKDPDSPARDFIDSRNYVSLSRPRGGNHQMTITADNWTTLVTFARFESQ